MWKEGSKITFQTVVKGSGKVALANAVAVVSEAGEASSSTSQSSAGGKYVATPSILAQFQIEVRCDFLGYGASD